MNGHSNAKGNLNFIECPSGDERTQICVLGTFFIALFTSNELRFAACGVGESEKCKESVDILGVVVHVSSDIHVWQLPA